MPRQILPGRRDEMQSTDSLDDGTTPLQIGSLRQVPRRAALGRGRQADGFRAERPDVANQGAERPHLSGGLLT